MSGPRPLATLTPTLLARKGGAKPAMRSQLQPMHEFHASTVAGSADDLGWNDMGTVEPEGDDGAEIVSIGGEPVQNSSAACAPTVVQQLSTLASKVAAKRHPLVASQGRRVAFTLRLDPERHLRLRLASAVLGRSAQEILTEALDSRLDALAEIEALAAKIRDGR